MVKRLRYLPTTTAIRDLIEEIVQGFEELCDELSLVAPLMVSPESIPQARFGQAIRAGPGSYV
jgi:hypothetical protein